MEEDKEVTASISTEKDVTKNNNNNNNNEESTETDLNTDNIEQQILNHEPMDDLAELEIDEKSLEIDENALDIDDALDYGEELKFDGEKSLGAIIALDAEKMDESDVKIDEKSDDLKIDDVERDDVKIDCFKTDDLKTDDSKPEDAKTDEMKDVSVDLDQSKDSYESAEKNVRFKSMSKDTDVSEMYNEATENTKKSEKPEKIDSDLNKFRSDSKSSSTKPDSKSYSAFKPRSVKTKKPEFKPMKRNDSEDDMEASVFQTRSKVQPRRTISIKMDSKTTRSEKKSSKMSNTSTDRLIDELDNKLKLNRTNSKTDDLPKITIKNDNFNEKVERAGNRKSRNYDESENPRSKSRSKSRSRSPKRSSRKEKKEKKSKRTAREDSGSRSRSKSKENKSKDRKRREDRSRSISPYPGRNQEKFDQVIESRVRSERYGKSHHVDKYKTFL